MDGIKKIVIYTLLYAVTTGIVVSIFLYSANPNNDYPVLRFFIVFFATILLTKYFLYMIVAPWHTVMTYAQHRALQRKQYKPKVSVIIPAWNERVGLLRTVESVLNSTYKNLEVVVINDGSTDTSDQLMRDFAKKYACSAAAADKPSLVYHYKKQNGGKGRALNDGIYLSTGSIIITTDADCLVTPETVANFVSYFKNPKVMAAVGNVKIGNTKTLLGTIQYLEFLFSFYFKKTESLFNVIYVIGGAAGAFRREVFDTVGMYNHANITEDIDLSVRIQNAGMAIVYAPDAFVYTEGATTVGALIKQRLRWKRGRFQTFKEHKHLFFSNKSKHNKLLTCVILPLALVGEVQLFFELHFIAFLYVYSYITHDFSSFISGIVIVSAMFFVQIFFEGGSTKRFAFYILAPIGWLLLYVSTYVEYHALVQALWGMARKKTSVWQKWERKGVLDLDNV